MCTMWELGGMVLPGTRVTWLWRELGLGFLLTLTWASGVLGRGEQ
jgi:hypothetical protein